jgi:Helix-turn-helix domain
LAPTMSEATAMGDNGDDLLTPAECSEALQGRVSRSTIYAACQDKFLKHYRVKASPRARGKLLVRRSDLMAWFEGLAVQPGEGETPPLRHITLP